MENGAVQIYYGEGHGKTNVAIGSAICAACEGKEAVIIQFLKGKNELHSYCCIFIQQRKTWYDIFPYIII